VTPPTVSESTSSARANSVATTGYGELFGSGPNTWYTQYSSGRSSASPIVAAAAASLSRAYEQANGAGPSLGWVWTMLINTGTPQICRGYVGAEQQGSREGQEVAATQRTGEAHPNFTG
jgi:hypothetical protein